MKLFNKSLITISLLYVGMTADAATLDPKILNNIHLGPDPVILPLDRRAQVEPHVARSFSDPNLLIATWQSGRYADGDGGAIGNEYAISRDGGYTWVREFVPGLTQDIDGGPFERATDPVGAIGFDNTIYQNSFGFYTPMDSPPYQLTVSMMGAEDVGLGAPITAFTDQWPTNWVDKNWIAVNSFPGSSTYGQMAVVGQVFMRDPNNNFTTTNVVSILTISNDGGQSWEEHWPFTPNYSYGLQSVYLPNGDLAVSFFLYRPPPVNEGGFYVKISKDGGDTFGPARTVVATISRNNVAGIRDGWFQHSLTSDRLRGILYMTWMEKTDRGDSEIRFARSVDGGNRWGTRMNVRDTLGGVAFNPAIAVSPDGQHVTIHFYDGRLESGLTNNVYLAESFDGGETWEPNVLLSSSPSDFANGPLTSEGYFYGDYQALTPALDFDTPGVAIWIDGRNGDPDPYVAQIARTQGTTYDAWKRMRFNTTELSNPDISGEGGDLEGDGIPNGIEYILGLEPDEVDGEPFVIKKFTSPDTMEVSYTALPVVTDKEIIWEKSANLIDWEAITPTSVTSTRATEAAFQDYTVKFDSTGEDVLFLRMGARTMVVP